ncbi:MAG: hypothetical protein OHK0017_02720 [Patescibacteria group bacterium]
MTPDKPRIRAILTILEPITLPTANSVLLLRAAVTEVISSGREVPTAMIVSEITD